MHKFEIKKAVKSEAPIILSFIKELAEYEKLSDSVKATKEILEDSLFGDNPSAECILVKENNNYSAFALYFYNFSSFEGRKGLYLEDLFVKTEYRGKGIGKLVLKYLAKLAVEQNCSRFEWTVINWNTPAIDFYKSIGAKTMDDWIIERLDGENLVKLASNL
ncbi:UNVERIFIED_CONTAM: hypothetical protein GTU68_017772 [Idotea baltica]|nr:hypothetical protein [Idotea baltica]